MEKVGDIIAKRQVIGRGGTRKPFLPDTEKLTALVFNQMIDLFGELWISRNDEILNRTEQHTKSFIRWCAKLDGLTRKQIKQGFVQVESDCVEASKNSKKSYPPNWAEFIGMCTMSHETVCHKPFDRSKALPDLGARDRAVEERKKHIKDIYAGLS